MYRLNLLNLKIERKSTLPTAQVSQTNTLYFTTNHFDTFHDNTFFFFRARFWSTASQIRIKRSVLIWILLGKIPNLFLFEIFLCQFIDVQVTWLFNIFVLDLYFLFFHYYKGMQFQNLQFSYFITFVCAQCKLRTMVRIV